MDYEYQTSRFSQASSNTYRLSQLRSPGQSQTSPPWLSSPPPHGDYGWPTSPEQASKPRSNRKAIPSSRQHQPVSLDDVTDYETQRPSHVRNTSFASVLSDLSQSEDAYFGDPRNSGRLRLLPYPPEPQTYSRRLFMLPPSQWRWLAGSWVMYCFLVIGIAGAISHHAYYDHLNGQPAKNQNTMLRYGTALAYITKASLVAAIIFALKQQIWATFRRKNIQISTIDSLFAAADDPSALLNLEMATKAKIAFTLATLVW
jgi:hypothetical protein